MRSSSTSVGNRSDAPENRCVQGVELFPCGSGRAVSGCAAAASPHCLPSLDDVGTPFMEEPGRRIVKDELKGEGSALPWIDETAFARRAVALALADRASAGALDRWVFFDRGLIDAAAGLQHLTGEPALAALSQSHRYHRRVFLTPPWPEIYVTDPERRHGLEKALAEYCRLLEVESALGCAIGFSSTASDVPEPMKSSDEGNSRVSEQPHQ
jgi:predicted ATPase